MSNRAARVAVIGAGGIANSVHLPSLKEIENANLVAVCDLRYDKAKAAAERFSIPGVYWDMYEMFQKEALDGVFVLVEPDRLFRVAQDCMRAGLPCMMEKPAGTSAHQTSALARISRETGKLCAVALNRRHIPLVQAVMKHMREITTITQVDGVFIKHTDLGHEWEYSNAFATDGIHAVDLVRYLAGGEVTACATVVGRFSGCPVDNAWSSVMKFDNGVTGTMKSNYQTGGRVHGFEMHGPGASAFINLGFGGAECEATILYHSGKSMYSLAAAGVGGQNIEKIDGKALAGSDQFHAYYGYKQEDQDFVNALLTGGRPLCTIDDAEGSVKLVEKLLSNVI
ncbi:MAG: Gfo/Idh/MocA family oxidoreductase [Clostridia bacterium]|nr:Gfo/Idh/MocA family oxidoreductase [Clostridia bacterium]MBO4885590.1 Gfo/Idh/MocA family oxidoreductase [Clostridia bacterium]